MTCAPIVGGQLPSAGCQDPPRAVRGERAAQLPRQPSQPQWRGAREPDVLAEGGAGHVGID